MDLYGPFYNPLSLTYTHLWSVSIWIYTLYEYQPGSAAWDVHGASMCCLPQLFSCEKDPSFHGENSYYLLSNYTISDDMLRTLHKHPCVILFLCLWDKYYYNLL